MKVQITVDDELWRRAKAFAAMSNMTLGMVVDRAMVYYLAQPGARESVITTGGLAKPPPERIQQ